MAAVALALAPSSVQAAGWRLAATSQTESPRTYAATFVDTATIRREGNVVSFRSLTVWEQDVSSADNSRSLTSADCRDHSFRDLGITYYKGPALVEQGKPEPRSIAGPGSARDRMIGAVCGTQVWLTGVVKDPYGWSRAAFGKLHAGGYWPLELGR